MQYHTLLWRLLVATFAKYWHTEVSPKENAQRLPPIRLYGSYQDVYLA